MHLTEVILYSFIIMSLFGFALYQAFREVKKGSKSQHHWERYGAEITMNTRADIKRDIAKLVRPLLGKKTPSKSSKKGLNKNGLIVRGRDIYLPLDKELREKYVKDEYLKKVKNKLRK